MLYEVITVGVRLGVISAIHHNRPTDHILRIGSIVGTSTPSFILGLLLEVTHEAMEDAGLRRDQLDGTRTSFPGRMPTA